MESVTKHYTEQLSEQEKQSNTNTIEHQPDVLSMTSSESQVDADSYESILERNAENSGPSTEHHSIKITLEAANQQYYQNVKFEEIELEHCTTVRFESDDEVANNKEETKSKRCATTETRYRYENIEITNEQSIKNRNTDFQRNMLVIENQSKSHTALIRNTKRKYQVKTTKSAAGQV